MNRAERITTALEQGLKPTYLNLIDESSRHAEHIEGSDGVGTHFQLIIESPQFVGMNKVKRHQAIYALLKDEFTGGLHAFAIEAYAPGERKTA